MGVISIALQFAKFRKALILSIICIPYGSMNDQMCPKIKRMKCGLQTIWRDYEKILQAVDLYTYHILITMVKQVIYTRIYGKLFATENQNGVLHINEYGIFQSYKIFDDFCWII